MTDFSRIQPRHDLINLRLEEWARWVTVRPHAWAMQPMFRQYQSKARQWETPEPKVALNPLAAHEVEKAVAFLPEKHRTAVRWAYVFSWIPVNRVRQELGVTRDGLGDLLDASRDMLVNRLKQHMVDVG